jgi:formate hydrogenlyase subunit 4
LILSIVIYSVHLIFLPLLMIGILRSIKAKLQNRCGPPITQPFWDVIKLFRKSETISTTTSRAFQSSTLVNLGVMVTVALMTPWLGVPSPIAGDLFLVVYTLALGKFCMSLSALDSGSPFGALGASREAALSIQTEPAMIIGLAALAVQSHSSTFSAMLGVHGPHLPILAILVTVAFWMSATAELARMPIDDPTTHLELTMIHEAQILENSGRNLALVEFVAALKLAVLLGLVSQLILLIIPVQSAVVSYLLSIGLLGASIFAIALLESVMVKLRWRRVPHLLSYAAGAGMVACLLVAMKG